MQTKSLLDKKRRKGKKEVRSRRTRIKDEIFLCQTSFSCINILECWKLLFVSVRQESTDNISVSLNLCRIEANAATKTSVVATLFKYYLGKSSYKDFWLHQILEYCSAEDNISYTLLCIILFCLVGCVFLVCKRWQRTIISWEEYGIITYIDTFMQKTRKIHCSILYLSMLLNQLLSRLNAVFPLWKLKCSPYCPKIVCREKNVLSSFMLMQINTETIHRRQYRCGHHFLWAEDK